MTKHKQNGKSEYDGDTGARVYQVSLSLDMSDSPKNDSSIPIPLEESSRSAKIGVGADRVVPVVLLSPLSTAIKFSAVTSPLV